VTGHGGASVGATGVNLVATIVPLAAKSKVLDPKPIVIPSVGYVSLIVLDIKDIPLVSVQNLRLKSNITNFALRYVNDVLTVDCPAINLLQSKKKHTAHIQNDGGSQFELPWKASLAVGVFRLFTLDGKDTVACETSCVNLNVTVEPATGSILGPMLKVQAIGSDFLSMQGTTVFETPRLSASGLVSSNDTTMFRNLSVGIEKAQLAAEFSSTSWSLDNLQEDDLPLEEIKLPFVVMPELDLTLKYAGALMNINDATISCSAYQGKANTTLSILTKHYVDIVVGRIPYLLARADVVGCNVGDSIGVMAGKALTHTSVIGATAGVMGRDVVGSALTMGKEARGASSSDKYQF